MKRHTEEEPFFGADSFLDVLANLVGILVVLIVIAGVQVSRTPPKPRVENIPPTVAIAAPPRPAPPKPKVVTPVPAPVMPVVPEPPPVVVAPAPVFVAPAPPPEPEPWPEVVLPPLLAPDNLVARHDTLTRDIALVQQSAAQLQQQQQSLVAQEQSLRARLQEAQAAAAKEQQTAAADRASLAALEAELKETQRTIAELRRCVDQTPAKPAPQVLKHHLTPIGRVINGRELHFLLSKNRVAPVPIDDLAARLGAQIQRQRDMLVKTPSFEGTIGPIDGFQMRYLIERAPLPLADERKYGGSVVRMSVTQWVLEPQPDLEYESGNRAMERGSNFYNALLAAGTTISLTFWVYPDSFELSRALQEFAHRHGYEVAARPLPEGVPITGSPEGSRSLAQ